MTKVKRLFSVLSIVVIIGFIWGIIISLPPIIANRYIQYGMFRLIGVSLQRNLNVAIFFSLSIFLISHFVWSLVTEKMRFAKNNIISFVITLGLLLSSWLCFESFTGNTLLDELTGFFIGTSELWVEEVSFSYLLDLLKTHFIAIMILTSWFIGTLILFCLLSKLKWEKVPKLIIFKWLKGAGFIAFAFLLVLNITIIIDGMVEPAGPNVILLIVEAWRTDSLGCYNKLSDATPNIDEFCRRAVLFKNPIAQGAWTTNSSASIFASVYPSEHKYSNYECRVSDKFNTIAEFLKNEKYQTFGISANPHVITRNGLAQGFETFVEDTVWKDTDCDEINERFIKWLENNKDRKFFAMLWYIDPHTPYEPPTEYINKYFVTEEERSQINNKAKNKRGQRKGPITEAEIEIAKKLYKGEVNFFDTEFRKLINYLKSNGLMENSIVLLTADHGESFGEKTFLGRRVRGHGSSLYEEQIRIPLIISLPGQKEGKVVTEKVQHLDILPTILEYVNPGTDVAGIPFLRGCGLKTSIDGKKIKRKYLFSQLIRDQEGMVHYRMESVQTESFKLVATHRYGSATFNPPDFQLFNLESGESKCDIADEDAKVLFEELKEQLLLWKDKLEGAEAGLKQSISTTGSKNNKSKSKGVTEEERLKERLRSLGYVQ